MSSGIISRRLYNDISLISELELKYILPKSFLVFLKNFIVQNDETEIGSQDSNYNFLTAKRKDIKQDFFTITIYHH